MNMDAAYYVGKARIKLMDLPPEGRVALALSLVADLCVESSVQGQQIPQDQKKAMTIRLAQNLGKAVSDFGLCLKTQVSPSIDCIFSRPPGNLDGAQTQ